MQVITSKMLKKCGSHAGDSRIKKRAADAVHVLGPLAPWWLQTCYLDMGATMLPNRAKSLRRRRCPDSRHGSCAIIFARPGSGNGGDTSFLREAFLLPVQWNRSDRQTPDDPALPPSVHQLADAVRGALAGEKSIKAKYWSLSLGEIDGIRGSVDLSRLDEETLSAESGWASLAAALLLLAEGGTPDPSVLATGCWNQASGLVGVGELAAKLGVLNDYAVDKIFLPECQRAQVQEMGPANARVGYLPSGFGAGNRPVARTALNPLLAALDVPPRAGGVDDKRAYYRRQSAIDRKMAETFYLEFMLGELMERCRTRTLERNAPRPVQLLITAASQNTPSLLPLAIKAFTPERCVVLMSQGDEKEKIERGYKRAEELVAKHGLDQTCKVESVDLPDEQTILNAGLGQFLAHLMENVPPGTVVSDVTPAQKYISLEMMRHARQGDQVAYLVHKLGDPGDEYYHIWPSGQEVTNER